MPPKRRALTKTRQTVSARHQLRSLQAAQVRSVQGHAAVAQRWPHYLANRLIAQIVGLERRVSRAGRDSIDHAPGAHDDLADAVAGVVAMLTTAKTPDI